MFKFAHFYDQVDFSPEQRIATTKAIIKLTDRAGSYSFAENRLMRSNKFKDGGVVF